MTPIATRLIDLRPIRLTRSRLLDVDGRVVVRPGEKVDPEQVVARGPRKVAPLVINLAAELGVAPRDCARYLQRRVRESVVLDQVVASRGGPLGFRPRVVRAPVAGVIREMLEETGELLLEPEVDETEITAVFPGSVLSIVGRRGITLETVALRAEGLAGIGPLVSGALLPVGPTADHALAAEDLDERVRDTILLVGRIEADAVVAASHAKVAGLVAGTCTTAEWERIQKLAAHPSIVLLEGFGEHGLSALAWDGFRPYGGRIAVLDPHPHHVEANWPELVLPVGADASDQPGPLELGPGAWVRICQGPHAPRVAEVARVSQLPSLLACGLEHRWVEVVLDGRRERVSQQAIELVATTR